MVRRFLAGVLYVNRRSKGLACRLVKLTGKHPEAVHPKHLLGDRSPLYWYLDFIPDSGYGGILDLGCGNGQHTLRVASVLSDYSWVMGIDLDKASLDVAKASRTKDRWASFHHGNATKLVCSAGLFEIVLCLDMLEHVHQRKEVLAEISRVLKPGGTLLLSVPNSGTTWKRLLRWAGLPSFSDPDHKVEYTYREILDEVNLAGFGVLEWKSSVADMPLVGLLDVVGAIHLPTYRWLLWLRAQAARLWPQENAGWNLVLRKGK